MSETHEGEAVAWIRADDLQEPEERRHVTASVKVATAWAEGFQPCLPLYLHPSSSIEGVKVKGDHQARVADWMLDCFGPEITKDKTERADRFVEEALELAQSIGWTADRGHALVDYVFGRPVGEVGQEVGGVMVTLAALCNVFEIDIEAEAKREVDRITRPEIVLKIRAKQAAKPTGSALPVALDPSPKPLEITDESKDTPFGHEYGEGVKLSSLTASIKESK